MPKPVAVKDSQHLSDEALEENARMLEAVLTDFGGVSVPLTAKKVIATTTLTPIRTGCATSEMIVATKTASRCCCCEFNSGRCPNQSAAPGRSTTAHRQKGVREVVLGEVAVPMVVAKMGPVISYRIS